MSRLSLDSAIKLSSGNSLSALGLGVWRAYGSECEDAVKEALKLGYRHSRFCHNVRLAADTW